MIICIILLETIFIILFLVVVCILVSTGPPTAGPQWHTSTPHHQHLNLLLLFLFSFFLQDQQFQFGLWYFFNKDIKIYK